MFHLIYFLTVIEVASGEYGGEFVDRMALMVDNGRVTNWEPTEDLKDRYLKMYNFNAIGTMKNHRKIEEFEEEMNPYNLKFQCSSWQQFAILFKRSSQQIYRNRVSEIETV